jgi:hypothetical protein
MTIATALAKAQADFPKVRFDQEAIIGPGRKYRYASLSAILDAVRPSLNKAGIFVTQDASHEDGVVSVTTRLLMGDQVLESRLSAPLTGGGFHALGSALTYLKRYGIASMLGIAAEDDEDGHQAQAASEAPVEPPAPRKPAAKPAGGNLTLEARIVDVRQTPWKDATKTAIAIENFEDRWASTFNAELGQFLAERKGREMRLSLVKKGQFWNVLTAVELTPSAGEVDQLEDGIPF